MNEHLKEIYDLILDRLPELAPELKPRPVGRRYSLTCPECRKPGEAYVYRNGYFIKCNRQNNCLLAAQPVSLWDYFQNREGWAQGDTLRGLAGLVGYSLPELPPETVERISQERAESQAREAAFMLFRTWYLFDPGADRVKEYLKGRGWTPGEIIDIEDVGYFSRPLIETAFHEGTISNDAVRNILRRLVDHVGSHSTLTIESYSLVFPWRGPSGEIKGFAFRALDDTKPKYLVSPVGLEKGLFNIHNARRTRSDVVYIVEGIIDALRINAGGLANVVALGGNSLKDAVGLLKASGFKHAVLMLDNDKGGTGGTAEAIKNLSRAGINASFVLIPDGSKDPDEYLSAGHTVEELKTLQPVSGLTWLTRRIMDAGGSTDIIKQRKALDAVIELANDVDPHLIDFKKLFETLAEYGISLELTEETRLEIVERRTREKIRSASVKALKKAAGEIEAGADPVAAFKDVESVVKSSASEKKPVKSLAEFLREKNAAEKKRDASKPLGFPLSKFKRVERQTDGIQPGFYLIAADPNVGKTAFSMNLAVDLITTNPGLTIYVYTLDDTKSIIINRLIGITSGQNLNKIQKRLRADPSLLSSVEAAYQKLIDWNISERLFIKDIEDVGHISDIEDDIEAAKESGKAPVIFIDALYNLQVDNVTPGGIREMNIDRAIQIKGIVDKFEVPLFCTVEVRKRKTDALHNAPTLYDIMETGKFAYNANLIWTLHEKENPDHNKACGCLEVVLSCVKNKLSHDKKPSEIIFYPQTSRIDEAVEEL